MPEPIQNEFSMLVQEYILYLRNVRGLGEKTVREYSKDLRTFFRFLNVTEDLCLARFHWKKSR